MPKQFTYRIFKRYVWSMTEIEHLPGVDLNSQKLAIITGKRLFKNDLNLRLVRVETEGRSVKDWKR